MLSKKEALEEALKSQSEHKKTERAAKLKRAVELGIYGLCISKICKQVGLSYGLVIKELSKHGIIAVSRDALTEASRTGESRSCMPGIERTKAHFSSEWYSEGNGANGSQ